MRAHYQGGEQQEQKKDDHGKGDNCNEHPVIDVAFRSRGRKVFLLTYNDKFVSLIISAVIDEGRKEMFYLTTHSTHFIYGYMAPDIWLRTILIVREREREMFYLTTHSTHFIYDYMVETYG